MDFNFPKDIADKMMDHMNKDHVDTMYDYCSHVGVGTSHNQPSMVHLDKRGFDLQLGHEIIHFDFDTLCNTPNDVRKILVTMAHAAKSN